jgi:uncharacterized protein DUF885
MLRAYWDFYPTVGAFLGFHRYDGRLPKFLPASVSRRVARVRRDLSTVERFERTGKLSPAARMEAGVLRSLFLDELFTLTDAKRQRENPMFTLGSLNIVNYLLKNYAPLDRRLSAVARLQSQVPEQVDMFRRITNPHLAEVNFETAEMVVSGITDSYERELPLALKAASPSVRQRVERTSSEALRGLRGLGDDLQKKYKPRVRKEFALGRRKYERMLWAEHLAKIPIERLLEVGAADLETNKRAFVDTAAKIDKSKGPREVMADIARDHPTAESLIPETQKMLEDIRSFIITHDVVTVPSEDRPTVMETPRFYRWASAAMNPPGPFEKVAKEAFYYVTPVDPSWPAEKAEEWLRYMNFTSVRNISVHECYPGHFVHLLHIRDRVTSPILKSSFSTAFTEGYAHYCEEMMIEVGFQGGDLRYRMAQLKDALLRDCRYISSIRMHVFGWTWSDATRFFMENAFMDQLPAEREAKRGVFDPGYLNYTLGKLMIKKLRADWMRVHKRASLREFHDAFLGLGAPPLGLAREALLGPGSGSAL